MSHLIEAWLENGIPHVRVRDAETGDVRLRWSRAAPAVSAAQDRRGERAAGSALQGLFKGLVLLSCASHFSLAGRAKFLGFGEECIGCDACDGGKISGALRPGCASNVVDMRDWRRPPGSGRP